ncbi:hypothetical protein U1Q18_000125, partial [Sarracenia purpurea var. burkii]
SISTSGHIPSTCADNVNVAENSVENVIRNMVENNTEIVYASQHAEIVPPNSAENINVAENGAENVNVAENDAENVYVSAHADYGTSVFADFGNVPSTHDVITDSTLRSGCISGCNDASTEHTATDILSSDYDVLEPIVPPNSTHHMVTTSKRSIFKPKVPLSLIAAVF